VLTAVAERVQPGLEREVGVVRRLGDEAGQRLNLHLVRLLGDCVFREASQQSLAGEPPEQPAFGQDFVSHEVLGVHGGFLGRFERLDGTLAEPPRTAGRPAGSKSRTLRTLPGRSAVKNFFYLCALVLCLAGSVRAGGRAVPANPCSVLWYDSTGISYPHATRMSSLGLDINATTDRSKINADTLAGYATLVIAFTPGYSPGLSQAVIQTYVQSGHGLLIEQPNAPGPVQYAPTGFEVTIASEYPCGYPGDPAWEIIVDSGHPITSGLSNADLPGAFDSVGSLGAGWTVLTRNQACNDPGLVVGNPGSGRVVFEAGSGGPNAAPYSGSDAYWVNVFKWLCSPGGGVPTRHSTWGTLKAAYR